MAEVSAHEAVQQVDLKQLPDEKKNIAALRECFPNAGASAEDAEDYPYLVYSLADGSRLFVFYALDDGTMTMLVLLTRAGMRRISQRWRRVRIHIKRC